MIYTQKALNAAAEKNWRLVFEYLDTKQVDINGRHENHFYGLTLLDYAHKETITVFSPHLIRHLQLLGGKTAKELETQKNTQKALDAAAGKNWKLVFKYLDSTLIDINGRHENHFHGLTLLDYAYVEFYAESSVFANYLIKHFQLLGGKSAEELDKEEKTKASVHIQSSVTKKQDMGSRPFTFRPFPWKPDKGTLLTFSPDKFDSEVIPGVTKPTIP